MHMVTNDEDRRDFLATEIQKRIVGPGLTSDVFVCKDDFSDEILDEKPTNLYVSGILYPNLSLGNTAEGQESDNVNEEEYSDTNDVTIGDDEDNIRCSRDSNQVNILDQERIINANYIGLAMCVDGNETKVNVNISYGKYRPLKSEEVKDCVKVKLGRCSLEQLKETFEYYNSCPTVIEHIEQFGCDSMSDLFVIDENELTISPKRIFKFKNKDNKNYINLKSSSFPRLLINAGVSLLLDLIKIIKNRPNNTIVLEDKQWKHLSWENFLDFIEIVERKQVGAIEIFKQTNNLNNLIEAFIYTEATKEISCIDNLNLEDNFLDEIRKLKVDDPVGEHLLPLLLKYEFYKREAKTLEYCIDISKTSSIYEHEFADEKLKLYWMVVRRDDKKYLKIQLKNIEEDDHQKVEISKYCLQTKLKVESKGILPYAEPHISSIDDDEYTLNEELYRDIRVYGKGINCSVDWDDNVENPAWISTTYSPQQRVQAFSPVTEYENTNNSCDVFNLTIWSGRDREKVLNGLRCIAEDYRTWMNTQEQSAEGGAEILNRVLSDQKEFEERLNENIKFLEDNDNAYKCFLLANTAMYIQMCIARDPKFKKNRDLSEYNGDNTLEDPWDYFSENSSNPKPKYRPFQLAFLLMNVKSIFDPTDKYRNENIDLIWFPTGGGKTEAYLALTALAIVERRMSNVEGIGVGGISVIMRYTLRLLTAQQFERASLLICALEYLRFKLSEFTDFGMSLGNDSITLGMWIGSSQTPNSTDLDPRQNSQRSNKWKSCLGALKYLSDTRNNVNSRTRCHWEVNYENFVNREDGQSLESNQSLKSNPFPISYCPWCGCKMVHINDKTVKHGYETDGKLKCINRFCFFTELPISYIDDIIYKQPPTLLFATVDKFAQLTSYNKGRMFSKYGEETVRKPDLIIQDELHLISGPLGSLVGMFESMVEELCTDRNNEGKIVRRPKIVTSTATTRNTLTLARQLYGRGVKTFPVSGIRYSDNFFSTALNWSESKRLYMGFAPTGHSASELEINAIAAELVSKEKLIETYLIENGVDLLNKDAIYKALTNDSVLKSDIDNYWTLVLYYINLKSLSRTHSRLGQEILAKAKGMRRYISEYPTLDFIIENFENRLTEFTSRQESSRIKELIVSAESKAKLNNEDRISVDYDMDIVQATNMISVGIDIARWNVIYMVGQPLTTAEYIQSSSRVGRTTYGLVVNIYNSLRNRELSYYENYKSYHQAFYKFVEPLTVTTFTEATLDRLMYNLYFCYMGIIKLKNTPHDVNNQDKEDMIKFLQQRCIDILGEDESMNNLIRTKVQNVYDKLHDDALRHNIMDNLSKENAMQSLRDIEPNTYIKYRN